MYVEYYIHLNIKCQKNVLCNLNYALKLSILFKKFVYYKNTTSKISKLFFFALNESTVNHNLTMNYLFVLVHK